MPTKRRPVLTVAAKAAILSPSGRVLIARESAQDKKNTKVGTYGLIGGRLDPGETFEHGLEREIKEETGLKVSIENPLYVGEWHPVIEGIAHQIIAIFILCKSNTENVSLSKEHDDYKWIEPGSRKKYPMMEPDCFVVDRLVDL